MSARLILVMGAGASVWFVLGLASLQCTLCNWRRFRADRVRAPLDGLEGLDTFRSAGASPVPRTWPHPGRLRTVHEADAYGSLAEDRASSYQVGGELIILVAGGLLGVVLPQIYRTGWAPYLVFVPLLVAVLGFVLRWRGVKIYEPLATLYRDREDALSRHDASLARRARAKRRGRI